MSFAPFLELCFINDRGLIFPKGALGDSEGETREPSIAQILGGSVNVFARENGIENYFSGGIFFEAPQPVLMMLLNGSPLGGTKLISKPREILNRPAFKAMHILNPNPSMIFPFVLEKFCFGAPPFSKKIF